MKKPQGNSSAYNEARAAWRARVNLSHTIFEVLFKDHMEKRAPHAGYEKTKPRAIASAARLTAHINTLAQEKTMIPRANIAQSFPQDDLFCTELSQVIAAPRSPVADPALRSWAALIFVAALYPHLPKNQWCATPTLVDAFTTALTDAKEPGSYYFASTLSAYHRINILTAALPMIANSLAKDKPALFSASQAVLSGLNTALVSIRRQAQAQADAHMNAPGVIPLRPRLGNPRPR